MQLTIVLFLNSLEVIYRMICCLLTNAYIAHRQNVVNVDVDVDSLCTLWMTERLCVYVWTWLNISPLLLIAWKVNAFSFNIFATWNPKKKKYISTWKKIQFVVFFLNFKVNQVYTMKRNQQQQQQQKTLVAHSISIPNSLCN